MLWIIYFIKYDDHTVNDSFYRSQKRLASNHLEKMPPKHAQVNTTFYSHILNTQIFPKIIYVKIAME